jgi:hypothetical protein
VPLRARCMPDRTVRISGSVNVDLTTFLLLESSPGYYPWARQRPAETICERNAEREPGVPYPCQNGQKIAVSGGEPRVTRAGADLARDRPRPRVKRPPKQ